MGMRDESWCGSCGCSQPYSEDVVTCGNCEAEYNEKRSLELINYIKLHLISIEQDLETLSEEMDKLDMNSKAFNELDFDYNVKSGEITATRHLLSVATDILHISNERVTI